MESDTLAAELIFVKTTNHRRKPRPIRARLDEERSRGDRAANDWHLQQVEDTLRNFGAAVIRLALYHKPDWLETALTFCSSQPAIARPTSSGLSSCTKWRPLTTT
jgi:hypothetical protein